MSKILTYTILAFALIVGGFFIFNSYIYNEKQADIAADYKNATYIFSGEQIVLKNGVSEVPAAPGSASMITTQYFGNEARGDLNGDGEEDVVFILTQDTGGSGTFFYLAGAIKESGGYRGTQAVLIGDRVAPQTTEFKNGLVVVNYAERAPGEPMSTQPSVGKSLYLKYDPVAMDFGEVVQNFEGEDDK